MYIRKEREKEREREIYLLLVVIYSPPIIISWSGLRPPVQHFTVGTRNIVHAASKLDRGKRLRHLIPPPPPRAQTFMFSNARLLIGLLPPDCINFREWLSGDHVTGHMTIGRPESTNDQQRLIIPLSPFPLNPYTS